MGVHSMTVSKWERFELEPTMYQLVLMDCMIYAVERNRRDGRDSLGPEIKRTLTERGAIYALYLVLRACYA